MQTGLDQCCGQMHHLDYCLKNLEPPLRYIRTQVCHLYHHYQRIKSQEGTRSDGGRSDLLGCVLFYFFYFFKDFIYLLMRDTERGRDIGRGRSKLLMGNPMWDSIPGPQDHNLSQRKDN